MNISSINSSILCALKENFGHTAAPSSTPLQLHEPEMTDAELGSVSRCLTGGWPSSASPDVKAFEDELSNVTGATFAIACVNGTAALHISLILAGVNSGDEVIMPAISFVGTANAAIYAGAHIHFLDVSEKNLGLDSTQLRSYLEKNTRQKNGKCISIATGKRIAAIVPVHVFGYACDIEEICKIAEEFCIPVVEDAAEALGSSKSGRSLGTFGKIGALSFNGNKIITTGGGGAIITDDAEIAQRARHLTTTAKQPHQWEFLHDELGYNYRMPGINAALGLGQIARLTDMLRRKRLLHKRYAEVFSKVPEVRLLDEGENETSNHWLNSIVVSGWSVGERNEFLRLAHSANYMVRPVWNLLPSLPHLSASTCADLQRARILVNNTISLPSSPFLCEVKG